MHSPRPMAADAITNADIAELLARESECTEGRAAKALRRASRAALMWPEEAGRLRDADRPFTELRAVGPFTARFISTWLREGTSVRERPPLRDGFLSYAGTRGRCEPRRLADRTRGRPADAHRRDRRRRKCGGHGRGSPPPRPSLRRDHGPQQDAEHHI